MNEKKNSKTLLIACLCVVVLGAGAWGLSKAFSKPQPNETQQLVAKAKADPGKMMDEFREKMRDEKLTQEQRDKLAMSMRNVWESRMDEAVDEYNKAKPEDREAILNKQIDEMEKFRKMREDRDREEEEKAKADGKSEEERQKEREKERERWRKSMGERSREQQKTDSETRNPNKMAQRMAYFAAMRKQMEARGIQPPRWGPGGGGGHGGGRGGFGRG